MVSSIKFCCCLPVRLGVFVLSGLTGALAAISAASIWYTVARASKNGLADPGKGTANINATNIDDTQSYQDALNSIQLDRTQYIAFIVSGILLTFLALFSIFGFVGTIIRKRGFVSTYSKAMWFFLGFTLSIGAFFIYALFRNRDSATQDCTAQTSEAKACKTATKFVIGLYIGVFVVMWLIMLYCCIIVRRYVQQLEEEQGFSHRSGGNKINLSGGKKSSFYPHQPLGKSDHEMSYPFMGKNAVASHA